MSFQIIVYVDQPLNKKQNNIYNTLSAQFDLLVDSVNGKDLSLLKKNAAINQRYFYLSDFLSMETIDQVTFTPDFTLVFGDDVDVSEKDWVCIERYLEQLFTPTYAAPIITERAQQLLKASIKPTPLKTPHEFTPPPVNEHYELTSRHVEAKDTMLIQVDKPFCDLPYTVVIRNYSTKGLKSFFTDLFICSSWGVARKDYEFLQQVWDFWKMEGEYNLDKMLLEATQRCFPTENNPQPDSEPEVYRRSIDQILENFANPGCHHSLDDDWNERRMKKRKQDDLLLN